MALSFRERSLRRKLIYAGVIVLLFFVMISYRRLVLDRAARENDLREIDLGEVDMGGSAARYTLASFRGPLICGLWWEVQERKAKNDWAQMELLTRALTKLQPHFQGPWLYLAWDWAYNVSVEFDRFIDKYHFIALGNQILAEGEKRNRALVHNPDTGRKEERGDPDMRFTIGWYMQQKMTTSDEAEYFQCFLQLGCIPPDDWDPVKLRQDPEKLKSFKSSYPRLVRRIREIRRVSERADNQLNSELLAFLEAHRNIPSLYPAGQPGAGPQLGQEDFKSFPLWPPGKAPANPANERDQDPHEIAHWWYVYSVEPLPPPVSDPILVDPAVLSRRQYRMPRSLNILIFRGYPAKVKGMQGEQLAKEGWFQESQQSWEAMYDLWKRFGADNGLDPGPERLAELDQLAQRYRERYAGGAPPEQEFANPKNDPELHAQLYLNWLTRHQGFGGVHYRHWEVVGDYNRRPETIEARRYFYNASHLRRADPQHALTEYEKGLDLWRGLLGTPYTGFLLDLGPQPTFGAALCLQPSEWIVRTPYGRDNQVQDEVAELLVGYHRVRAMCGAPGQMQVWTTGWEAGQWGMRASPLPPSLGLGYLPVTASPITIVWVEDQIELAPGGLDSHLDPGVRQKARSQRAIGRTPAAETGPFPTVAPAASDAR